MRSSIASVAFGATAGACVALFRVLGFSSWEIQVLPWVFGAMAWQAIRNGGKAVAQQENTRGDSRAEPEKSGESTGLEDGG